MTEQRRIARLLCQDENGKCLHDEATCDSHVECAFTNKAQRLLTANIKYGKWAVQEFVEKLKKIIYDNIERFVRGEIDIDPYGVSDEQIDELYKELYGDD